MHATKPSRTANVEPNLETLLSHWVKREGRGGQRAAESGVAIGPVCGAVFVVVGSRPCRKRVVGWRVHKGPLNALKKNLVLPLTSLPSPLQRPRFTVRTRMTSSWKIRCGSPSKRLSQPEPNRVRESDLCSLEAGTSQKTTPNSPHSSHGKVDFGGARKVREVWLRHVRFRIDS